MAQQQTVLLVGGTGRTGRRVLGQLLDRNVSVRAIVRSVQKLPADAVANANLTVVQSDLLSLSAAELLRLLSGCDAVISCLGHVISLKGVLGPPRDLVTAATARLCNGIMELRPAAPVKFILMSSVSVNRPGRADTRRGMLERVILWILRGVLPPANDNQQAANYLFDSVGTANPHIQWVVVRPDTLVEGNVSEYKLHESLVASLFAPNSTSMANVAHFMCELVANPQTWHEWKAKMPVIVNATDSQATSFSTQQ